MEIITLQKCIFTYQNFYKSFKLRLNKRHSQLKTKYCRSHTHRRCHDNARVWGGMADVREVPNYSQPGHDYFCTD